jgi:tetratricopeptide (TPR) repeat protein
LWNLLLANLQESKAGPAIEYGEKSLTLARELNLREQMAYTLSDLGWAYNMACQLEEAEARLVEGASLWRELSNMTMLTNNLNAWLLNLVWSGKYDQALGIAQESLEISRATKNIWNQGWPHNLQGQIWVEYGEIDKALDELEMSVRLAQEANTPVYVAWFRSILCTAYLAIGAVEKGADLYRTTRLPNQDVPISPARTSTFVGYALCEIATGQLDLAASTLDACTLNNSIWDYGLKLTQCRLALAQKDHAKAIAIADALVAEDRPFKLGQYLPEALFLQGQAHQMNGEQDLAKAAFEQARLAAETLGSRRLLWQILAALAETESDEQKAATFKAQAYETVQFIADHMKSDEFRSAFLQLPDLRALMA